MDKKGNEKVYEVVDATYDSLDLMDVNWDNFSSDDVWDLADKYTLHPAFQ